MILRTNRYAPHILSAAWARPGTGRRRASHASTTNLPWYTTYVVHSGAAQLHQGETIERLLAPTAIILPPASSMQIQIPAAAEHTWFDWGVTTAKRTRAPLARAHYATPTRPHSQQAKTCGSGSAAVLAQALTAATMSLSERVVSRWHSGPTGQAAADADLAVWLMQLIEHLQPTRPTSAWLTAQPNSRGRELATQPGRICHRCRPSNVGRP